MFGVCEARSGSRSLRFPFSLVRVPPSAREVVLLFYMVGILLCFSDSPSLVIDVVVNRVSLFNEVARTRPSR